MRIGHTDFGVADLRLAVVLVVVLVVVLILVLVLILIVLIVILLVLILVLVFHYNFLQVFVLRFCRYFKDSQKFKIYPWV